MMRVEITQGQVVIHVDDDGADRLRQAATDAKEQHAKVFLGDPGAMLIVRHEDYE